MFYRRALCTFGCCWLLPALFDGASFVSGMCNLPSWCLGLHAEKAFLVLCLPGNPSDGCVSPASRTTLTYSCPTGCSETDWHARASEGGRALPPLPLSNSLGAAAADGLWRLDHLAHGSNCGPPIVKFKGRIWGQDWIGVASPALFTLTAFFFFAQDSFLLSGILTGMQRLKGQHTVKHQHQLNKMLDLAFKLFDWF